MLKKTEDSPVQGSKGLNTIYNILSLEKDQTPNCMDVVINYDGSIEERMGTNTQNSVIIAQSAPSGFNVNVSNLTNGLVSFWKLDEPSGNRKDAYGTVTLLDSGGVGQSSGIKSQSALFNASTGQCLYQVNPPALTNNKSFSISSWIYLNSTSNSLQRTIVSKEDKGLASNISCLLHMDGADGSTTFTDSSLSPHTFSATGAAKISTTQSKFGGASGVFTGPGNYITTPQSTDFDLGNTWTIDCWINFTAGGGRLCGKNSGGYWLISFEGGSVYLYINATQYALTSFSPTLGTWYHFAFVNNGGTFTIYLNGSSIGTQGSVPALPTINAPFGVGDDGSGAVSMNAYIDEFRVLKGTAAWTSNFSVPTSAYSNPSSGTQFEYWLYVDTNNQASFNVSSSGTATNGYVTASSFGALTTSNWYNVIGWVDSTNSVIGISVNLSVNTSSYTSGVFTGSSPFTLGAVSNGASSFFDGRIDETGFWNLALNSSNRIDLYNGGSGNTLNTSFSNNPWASFDFGASGTRWLTCAAGTGIYASSNLGVTWVNIATDRTASYQYFDRSKNVLVATSEAYDTPLAWAGSTGTFAIALNSNATATKYNINFQGFLILLNSSLRKRGFFYNDENSQLTGTWVNNFDIPSSNDDEITSAFVLRRYLYVSTRYKLFRVNYVGGNPDWQFVELKNWGFIPRTVKKIVLTNQTPGIGLYYSIGEIAVGLTWDRKIRAFDGSNDQIISNNVELDNGQCDFALNKISYQGSGPVISFSESDPINNVYRLAVAIGTDSVNTTHFLNYDGRAFAFYPWSNMPYNTMCMAESANFRFLMAFDRSGYVHMMNSGNLDANKTSITGIYDSPLIFNKTPSQSTKGHKVDLFFTNNTAGNLSYYDRIDFSDKFNLRRNFAITGTSPKIIHYETIDTPEMYNTYQFRLMRNNSSVGLNNDPWRVLRYDLFNQGMGIGKND